MAQDSEAICSGVEVTLDPPSRVSEPIAENSTAAPAGIHAIDSGYDALKPHLEKGKRLVGSSSRCLLCNENLLPDGTITLVCPNATCEAIGHLECFAASFLTKDPESLVPTTGNCPSCGTKLTWIELVKELSLRMRGEKEVEKIFKVRKTRAPKAFVGVGCVETAEEEPEEDGDEGSEDEVPDIDDWQYLSDKSDKCVDVDDIMSDPSPLRNAQTSSRSVVLPQSEPCIEDSDWDDADVVT